MGGPFWRPQEALPLPPVRAIAKRKCDYISVGAITHKCALFGRCSGLLSRTFSRPALATRRRPVEHVIADLDGLDQAVAPPGLDIHSVERDRVFRDISRAESIHREFLLQALALAHAPGVLRCCSSPLQVNENWQACFQGGAPDRQPGRPRMRIAWPISCDGKRLRLWPSRHPRLRPAPRSTSLPQDSAAQRALF